jgi:tetratricopeptide (TPR) repeat protein
VWLAFAAAACAPERASLPLDAPAEPVAAPVAAPTNPAPQVVEEQTSITFEEEALPDENAAPTVSAPSDAGTGGGLSVEPPPLLGTIDDSTAPNVAAATRLVEAGRTRMAAGDTGAALEQFERAIVIDPSNPYAYYYLAELHLMNRTYDQAIAFADRAASLSETRAPEWASRAFTLQGNAFEAAGRFADARNAYTRAVQAAPGNLAAQVGLARVGGPPAPQP